MIPLSIKFLINVHFVTTMQPIDPWGYQCTSYLFNLHPFLHLLTGTSKYDLHQLLTQLHHHNQLQGSRGRVSNFIQVSVLLHASSESNPHNYSAQQLEQGCSLLPGGCSFLKNNLSL